MDNKKQSVINAGNFPKPQNRFQTERESKEVLLQQNYPNPFSRKTTITFFIPRPGIINLLIYNRHKEILRVLQDGYLAAGVHQFSWDSRSSEGKLVEDGSYYYSLEGEGVIVGNRDFSSDTWLYTPPLGRLFKGFLHHYSHFGRFDDLSVQDDWFGAGLDYTYCDLSGQVEILRRLTDNPDYGYRLFGRWNMNDYWEASTEYNHNGIDLPFKGRIVDLKGNRTRLNLGWRPSDLTNFSGTVTFYDYSDGNRRQAFLFYAFRQLFASPYHWLTAQLELYTSKGTLRDRYYYNPETDASYLFTLDFWQIIHRRYDFKFVHRLVVSYGTYWQKHYEPGWVGIIRYEHHWDIDDRRAFLYGISYYRRVYDGRPESGFNVYATINWRF